jgi:hypothetical protein
MYLNARGKEVKDMYNAPELRLIGRAAALVQGDDLGHGDKLEPTDANNHRPDMEIGLDD